MSYSGVMLALLMLFFVASVLGEPTDMPSVNEFDIDELNLYNNMVSCVSTFKLQFVKCNKHLQNLAKNVFTWINENSTIGGIIKCCGVWMARDCWLSHAHETCIDEHIKDIYILPFKLLPKLDRWCDVYTDRAFVCRLPHYLAPTFVLISAIVTVAVMVVVAFKLRSAKIKQLRAAQLGEAGLKEMEESRADQVLLDQNENENVPSHELH